MDVQDTLTKPFSRSGDLSSLLSVYIVISTLVSRFDETCETFENSYLH